MRYGVIVIETLEGRSILRISAIFRLFLFLVSSFLISDPTIPPFVTSRPEARL